MKPKNQNTDGKSGKFRKFLEKLEGKPMGFLAGLTSRGLAEYMNSNLPLDEKILFHSPEKIFAYGLISVTVTPIADELFYLAQKYIYREKEVERHLATNLINPVYMGVGAMVLGFAKYGLEALLK